MPMIPGFPIESLTFLSKVIDVRGLKLHQGCKASSTRSSPIAVLRLRNSTEILFSRDIEDFILVHVCRKKNLILYIWKIM